MEEGERISVDKETLEAVFRACAAIGPRPPFSPERVEELVKAIWSLKFAEPGQEP
jgi:hypothetical protein